MPSPFLPMGWPSAKMSVAYHHLGSERRATTPKEVRIEFETHARILPVNVDAVNALLLGKLSKIRRKGISIVDNGRADNFEQDGFRRMRPAAKRYDALDVLQSLEVIPLLIVVFDDGLPGFWIDVKEGPMDVSVCAIGIGILGLQPEAIAFEVERLVVPNTLKGCGRGRIRLDFVAAVGDACVAIALLHAAGTSPGGRVDVAVHRKQAAEAPIAATRV